MSVKAHGRCVGGKQTLRHLLKGLEEARVLVPTRVLAPSPEVLRATVPCEECVCPTSRFRDEAAPRGCWSPT